MITFFEERVGNDEAFALVTVLSTEGSSYSKAGHPLLVAEDGELAGLLSGGCLENDLIERCREVIRDGQARLVEYDLRDDDGLLGLGVGCEGVMRVLVWPLSRANGYEPVSRALAALRTNPCIDVRIQLGGDAWTVRWVRPANVLVLGAGPDALPLLEICRSLGWAVTINDHRPAWIERVPRDGAVDILDIPYDDLANSLNLDAYDAAIVMSHNLVADGSYLEQLAKSDIDFVGLLGPPHRRDRILGDLQDIAGSLDGRLRSPVGRMIGGRGPASIALEIAVELQEYFCALDQRLAADKRSPGVSISIDAGSNSITSTA